MSGAAWAAISGVGFGLFQALNARAVRDLDSVYLSTFLQLIVAVAVLGAASLATEDVSSLASASARSLVAFALAGMVHFLVGWTMLNVSQARIGAARTSPLLSTTPVFGLLFAVVAASQLPNWLAAVGIGVTIVGAYLVTDPGRGERARPRDSVSGLAAAAALSVSAILTLEGLETFDSPLLGVTLGMFAAATAYGLLLVVSKARLSIKDDAREAVALKALAGVIVALATWGRWFALDDTDVAGVLALNLLSVPVVLVAAPLISGRHVELVTRRIWGGAALVVAGSLLLIVDG